MDRTSALTKDCFNALNQLRALESRDVVSPQVLHRRISDLVDRLLGGARDQGTSERDAKDMAYAIVALADEIAVGKAGGIDEYWRGNLLQMKFFDENVAGEGFFRRLETLRRDHRRVDVLRAYYLCLLFGFQGIYTGRAEGELRRLTDSVGNEIEQGLEIAPELSPDGLRPDDALIKRRESRPLLWIAMGCLAASLALYITLRVVLDGQTDRIVEGVQLGPKNGGGYGGPP
jgi:type VI secretion system protein ImpK